MTTPAINIRDHGHTRRTPEQIEQLFKDATQSNHISTKPTNNGLRINFQNDQDINMIFEQETINKLSDVNLKTSLADTSQLEREIYVSDIPNDIYNKQELEL